MAKEDMVINPITGEIDLDLHRIVKGFSTGGQSLKDSLELDTPRRTPSHPSSSHVVKTKVDGKDKMIRFGEQGAKTNQNPKQRKAFKDRHAKNIAKGKSSAAYWADKVKWKAAEGGAVETGGPVDLARNVIGQGLLLGWGDEAEAWVRSKLGEGTYEEAVAEIRAGNEAYSEDSPYASLAGEIVGGLIPTAAALVATPFTGGASTAAASGNLARLASIGARRLGPLGTAGVVGATEGAIAGAGMSEEGSRLKGAGTGAVIGGTLGTGIQKGSELALGALNRRAASKAARTETDAVDENKRKLMTMIAAAPMAAALPDISKVATRKAARALTLPKVVTSADMDVSKLSELVTKLYNKNRSSGERPAVDSTSALGEFTPVDEEKFMRGNLAEILDFIEVEKLGTRKGGTGDPADSAKYYEGFSDPDLTDIARSVEDITDNQKDTFDSVFGQGWDEGVEKINLTGVADGYDNEGLSLAVRKFREETDRPIAPDTKNQKAIKESIREAEAQRGYDLEHISQQKYLKKNILNSTSDRISDPDLKAELKNLEKSYGFSERYGNFKGVNSITGAVENFETPIEELSTDLIERILNDVENPGPGSVSRVTVTGNPRFAYVEELLKRKPVEQWNYTFSKADRPVEFPDFEPTYTSKISGLSTGPYKSTDLQAPRYETDFYGQKRRLPPVLTPELDVEWMLKTKDDIQNRVNKNYDPKDYQVEVRYSGPVGSEMSEDEMKAFVKWAREKGVKKYPEYKAIQKRRRDAKKEAKEFDEGYAKGGAVYNPNLIKKNAVQLLMEANNG